uniref:RxLR effector protein n=1 Tax=Phytophthora sojae TaxID=67593 RepID=G1FR99_PHYSO|nr:Avh88 [Phytophthora sojae]AEK80638.1 Avh88 [Phytophthora sojae]
MRPSFIFAVVFVATLHACGASVPSAENTNALVKNGASPGTTALTGADGGRILRRVDDIDEERGLKEFLEKLKLVIPPRLRGRPQKPKK